MKALKIIFLPVLFLLASCAADKRKEEPQKETCYDVAEVLIAYGNDKNGPGDSLFYDSRGRVTKVVHELTSQVTYDYLESRIQMKGTNILGTDISTTFFLDDQKRIVRTTANYEFGYNSEGYLIFCKFPIDNNGTVTGYSTLDFKYEGGNVTEVSETEGRTVTTRKFEYFDEPQQDLMGWNSPLFGAGFFSDIYVFYLSEAGYFGKSGKNLLKSFNDRKGNILMRKYKKDAQGRIVLMDEGRAFVYKCD
ncbi:MAG TPA: DUF4595 domain-containing protein [Pedobacter sp.]|nr:DUF4595 domain-containing protein [Pedobacter sp.]